MIAYMIRFVSVSSVGTSAGPAGRRGPDLRRVGRLSTFGSRHERGHTFSVPHRPIGMTGARVIAASRAAPQRPFSTGSKNAGPAGSCPAA